ncbi:MAG TPA: TRAM domain-containing protein [Ilumatobacteraceae bacterium]|nr:TRAM domain-containing protein [Ilumatobacteraceae bacterium]
MESPAVLTLRTERFVAGGDALAKADDGRVVFVRGALPGELVSVEVTEEKRDWSRGDVVDVVEPSFDRVIPPCPYRIAGCGGCDWQHVAVSAQMTAKAALLADAMRRTGGLNEAVIITGESAPPTAYRTSVRVVGSSSGRAAFRRERSNEPIEVDVCMVAHPALFDVLRDVTIDRDVELTLRVSEATGQMTAIWDRRTGDVAGLPGSVQTGSNAVLYEDVAGHRFRVSAGSFFQSGPAAAGLLVDAVRRAAPEIDMADHVVDAYAGVGLFGLAAVSASSRTTSLETSRSAVQDAAVNLAGRAATVVRGEVGAWRAEGEPVDVVIADPARSGLGKPGSAALAAAGAPVLVLVSCDPVSLARDTALLRGHGYRHVQTEVLDLFPMTHHVEAVTRFVADREAARDARALAH